MLSALACRPLWTLSFPSSSPCKLTWPKRELSAQSLLPLDKVARWQNLIPSSPWIAPGWRAWGRNPRKGRDQILPSGNLGRRFGERGGGGLHVGRVPAEAGKGRRSDNGPDSWHGGHMEGKSGAGLAFYACHATNLVLKEFLTYVYIAGFSKSFQGQRLPISFL